MNNISSEELTEWMIYYSIEPFGNEIENYRTGIVASTIANVNRGSKSDRVFEPEDFTPKVNTKEKFQSTEEQLRNMQLVALAINASRE